MADLLGIVLSPIVEWASDPMKRHISYAFKCKRNVNNLEEGMKDLKGEQERLEDLVEVERRNGKLIYSDVNEWLEKAVIVEKEGNELVLASERAEMKCFFGFCPNLKTRYQVSKKAEKKARELAKLLEKGKGFSSISYDAPLQCMVGVHGIGGVGKTTLAEEILRQVKEQKLFDEVVMATITKVVNVFKIQAKIGEALGLKFDGVETEEGRASRLFGRLELDKEKKVLIILDDLWEKLDLVEVGIPSKNQLSGCKIFLTSRDLNVLSNEMDCQQNFEVGCLPQKEAWDLLGKMSRACKKT